MGPRAQTSWVKAALEVWHEIAPDRFPEDLSWRTRDEWLTPEEVRLANEMKAVAEERDRRVNEFDRRLTALRGQLVAAKEQADGEERALLTSSGSELVASVSLALQRLGFRVEDRDQVNKPGDKLEDLRVTAPDDPEWLAIVEVTALKGGGAVGDLANLERFERRLVQQEGREATRKWYIVSQFVGQDPGQRPPVFKSSPSDLANFAADHGLAMDTATLFQLLRDVESSALAATDVRRRLMIETGRLEQTPESPP
jgi:hypothetical protein